MSSTSGGPTELEQLRRDFGGRWRIDYAQGRYHAVSRAPAYPGTMLPRVLVGDTATELRAELVRVEGAPPETCGGPAAPLSPVRDEARTAAPPAAPAGG